jgi:hypothetical protein
VHDLFLPGNHLIPRCDEHSVAATGPTLSTRPGAGAPRSRGGERKKIASSMTCGAHGHCSI